ncbi:MAG TPA: lipoyl domain-containing protein [Gaiellaceae bacterium]|jgi:pyruvate/2-oxoglutarate dehydrogenase complex dihydrolipoamide acyltransferase (E2) component|nr:lipoyl domain-containing protein [Gaiellaceae bacterium]
MTTNVLLEEVAQGMTQAVVTRWYATEGDAVNEGDPLLEVESDKVTVEVPAPTSGRLDQVVALVGDEVPVGAILATIEAQ